MSKIVLPNWDKSIINTISSILKYYNINNGYEKLQSLDDAFNKKPKNVVLMILDGLGVHNLEYFSPNGSLRKHQIDQVTSVCPSTTVAATTTYESGVTPYEHGWLGWTMYFKEINKYVDVFPNRDALSGRPLDIKIGDCKNLIKYNDVYEMIYRTNIDVSCYSMHPSQIMRDKKYCKSVPYDSIEEGFKNIVETCNKYGKKYIYFYSLMPDYMMHELGTKNRSICNEIQRIEKMIEELSNRLEDTLIIVTADHGLIDIGEDIYINNYKEINECLKMYPTLEGRATSFFIKEGMNEKFEYEFKKRFSHDFILFSKEEALRINLFGKGKMNSRFDDFMGDYIACAVNNSSFIFDYKARNQKERMLAHHAGLTEIEMLVPIIIYSK